MAFRLNPLSGQFDWVTSGSGSSSADNFSYNIIPTAVTVIIPQYQQMLFSGPMEVDGELEINGQVHEVE